MRRQTCGGFAFFCFKTLRIIFASGKFLLEGNERIY